MKNAWVPLSWGDAEDPCVYVMGEEALALPPLPGMTVVALPRADWYQDFSPWPAPPLNKRGPAFSGGADAYLAALTAEIIPGAEKALNLRPRRRALAGYSLAGLFSLYALTRSPLFSACACVSGSLWFPGWIEYLERAVFAAAPDYVYLSLGDRESHSRNPLLSTAGQAMEQTLSLLQKRGIPCVFAWNAGGHFENAQGRLRQGIEALHTNIFRQNAKNG